MFKENIRERLANKLQLTRIILETIQAGKPVKPDMADKAIKDLDSMMSWIDETERKTNPNK